MDIKDFIARWRHTEASERANKDSFLKDLCRVLGVAEPDGKTGDPTLDTYVFEADAVVYAEGQRRTTGRMDLYKQGCFVLEAKQGSGPRSKKVGHARRNTPGWSAAMQLAMGQAFGYARTLDQPPPFVIVTDIGYCFDLYACFDGTDDVVARLVSLNKVRVFEEAGGTCKYLRPEIQSASATVRGAEGPLAVPDRGETLQLPWPNELPEQVAAVRDLITSMAASLTANDVARGYLGATAKGVVPALRTLEALGMAVSFGEDERQWKALARTTGERAHSSSWPAGAEQLRASSG